MRTVKDTQCDRIIDYIHRFGSITQLQALADLGIMRLASRVSDLSKAGYPITRQITHGKNRMGEPIHYATYYLKEDLNDA